MAAKEDQPWNNPFDQGSRYMAKLDPLGMILWLLGLEEKDLLFRRWLDARRLAIPGEPDRENDTVAHVENPAQNHLPWALVLEFNVRPDHLMTARLLEYLGMIWRDEKPSPERGDRFQLGAIVVNLTGAGRAGHDAQWPPIGLRTILTPVEVNLCEKDAEEILRDIAELRAPRIILPWIPLMRGAEREAVIETWKAIGLTEPDLRKRSEYGALATIFVEAVANRVEIWQNALKEWDMTESKVVRRWEKLGEQKGLIKGREEGKLDQARHMLLRTLEKRFGTVSPEEVTMLEASQDLDWLAQLLDDAYNCESLPAFLQILNAPKEG